MINGKQVLPQWAYELLRWFVSVVMPAVATFLSVMNAAWGWGWPIEAILTTFGAVETLLGIVFLGAKYSTDAEERKEQE